MDQPLPAPYSEKLKVDPDVIKYLNKQKKEIIEKLKESTITDEDIRNLEPHPSDCRLAYFASEVYNDDCTIPEDWNWTLLIKASNTSRGNGYVGAAFFDPLQQQLIIAHRGTASLNAAWTDLKSIVCGSVSSQMSSALTFSDFIRDVIVELQSEKKWRYQLSFTGHSLGGFLAQITTFGVKYLKRYDKVGLFLKSTDAGIHGHCVTFDNPGCAEMLNKITDHCDLRYLKRIFPSALDLTAYLSAPNMVNTCNRHVGVVLRLQLSFQEMSEWSAKTTLYHLKTHNMDKIKSVFDPEEEKINVEVEQMFDWPVACGSSSETRKIFKSAKVETNFIPNIGETTIVIEGGRFNKIRYLPETPSIYSYCNVALFSEDELALLKDWPKIVKSPIKIDEMFTPLNLPFKDLFYPFEQFGDDFLFHSKTSMKETIKRCKQIFRWYPEEIENCMKQLSLKSYDVIMKFGVNSYNESIKKCKVDFNDSIKLKNFLEAKENNVLTIKANVRNHEIEMLRLFNIFKQIRSIKIDKYTAEDCFLFVNQSTLQTFFAYTELDLFINSKLNLLIVDLANETVDDDVSKLIRGFAKNDRKVVIVTSSKEKTTLDFKFSDLTEDSRKNVLEKYKIIKLGNQTYTLETFLKTDDENWAEELTFLDDYEFLERILNDRCIELKSDSLNFSKLENFYIQAADEQNYSIDDFAKLTRNFNYDLNESKILITHVSDLPPAIEEVRIPCDKLKTADLDEASQYFKKRCDEESSRKFYWFHYDRNFSLKQIYNPRLYIRRSFNEMVLDETKTTTSIKGELLRQEEKKTDRVTVELTKTDKLSHDVSLTEDKLADRRLVLITGDPGIGKSTTVTNILSKMERSWIFKLTYDDCTKIVKNLNGKFDVDQISRQLLRIKSNDQFDFLKYQLVHETPIKVVFLFDELFDSSYDQNYEERIIEFLKYLCDETESFVIVTARETNREMIENALNICSIQFKQLDPKDVEGYLTNYWSELFHFDLILHRLTLKRLDDYIKELLAKAEKIFNRQILNFIGIPLQTKLLAEVAAPNYASLSQQSSELIPLELPDNLTEIYEVFVEKKLAIVCKKSGVGKSHLVKKVFLESIEKKLRAFAASKYGFYDKVKNEELETLQQTGLVQGSEFIHQTVQEFYFARQLFAWLKKRNGRREDKQPNLVEFLLDKIFGSWKFNIVRMFLDIYISKITPEDAPFYSHKIAVVFKERPYKKYGVGDTMALETLIREHCQGTVIFLLDSLKYYYTTENFLSLLKANFMHNSRETFLYFACNSNQTLLIDYFVQLLEAQSKKIQKEIMCKSFYFNQPPIHRVYVEEMFNAIKNFTARVRPSSSIEGIVDLIKNDIGLLRDLMLAAKNGALEIVRNCLTNVSETFKLHLLNAIIIDDDYNGGNALHLAIKYGHPDIVRFLIEQGADYNKKGSYLYEITPFHFAAAEGNADVVKYFLEELKYEEVNEKDSVGDTALHHAVENKRKSVLEILLKHDGIDVIEKNHNGWRPLDYAIKSGDLELVKMIVEAGATIDCEYEASEAGNLEILRCLIENGGDYKKGDSWGVTLFHRAAEKGHADVVKYFLEELKYEEVNEKDLSGNTALHKAVKNRRNGVVEILLNHDGIDVNAKNCFGERPLDYAIKSGDVELVKMIVEAGATIDCEYEKDDSSLGNYKWIPPVARASETGNLEIVRYLIENGGDYKKGNDKGITPLHRVAAQGHADVVVYFLKELNNEEVNEKDSVIGNTALHYAVENKRKSVLEILLKHDGIDVNAMNRFGERPLDCAIETGDFEIVKMIVDAGATINCKYKKNGTPFHRAAARGNADIVKYFLEELKYEEVNEKDSFIGDTALHKAVKNRRKRVMEILLNHCGIEMNAKNRFGKRPLDYAIEMRDFELVKMIVEAGATIDCEYEQIDDSFENFDVISPICRASDYGNLEIVRYLIENGGDYKKGDSRGVTPFHRAAAGEYADIVKYFLEKLKYEEVNEKDSFIGDTALHKAVKNRRKRVMEILLNHCGIEMNAKNRFGKRPLDYAIETRDFELVKMIVDAGAAIDCEYEQIDDSFENFDGISPICRASDYGNLHILHYLIENGADYKKGNDEGVTPFHRAAEEGHADIVKYFLEKLKYEAVNEKDSDGNTALHYAVKNKRKRVRKKVVEILLKHDGIDVNAKNHEGKRPLDYAIKSGDVELVKMIVEAGAAIDCEYEKDDSLGRDFKWIPPVARASATGNLEILRYLIENGADYKKGNDEGVTPFHRAAKKGYDVMVEYFLEELKNKEVNEKDADDNTALHYAVMSLYRRKRVVEILLKHRGIDVNAKNRFGWRPLDCAIGRRDFELVKMIVEAGAAIDCEYEKDDSLGRDFKWIPPVARASATGNLRILCYLIENGGDYKKGDSRGVTPFHRAAEEGHADIVKYFLEKLNNEAVNEKDSDGNTALHYAVKNKRKRVRKKVVEILLKHKGIDVDAKNRKGKRPLDYAIKSKDFELVNAIVKAAATITELKKKKKRKKKPTMFKWDRLFKKNNTSCTEKKL